MPDAITNPNEATLRRQLRFIVEGIVRSRHASKQREVRLRKWYTAVSVVFSLLGTVGLVKTKVDALPAMEMSWAFIVAMVSLVVVILLELYRAFGVEQTALRLLAAKEAYSLLDVETRHALEEDNPLPLLQQARTQAHSLEKMFHQALPPVIDLEATTYAEQLIKSYRPEGGWDLPLSQQKTRRNKQGDA